MSDNVATLAGYTVEIALTGQGGELYLLVKPGTDYDGTFTAWDTDCQEFIRVNGWLWRVARALA